MEYGGTSGAGAVTKMSNDGGIDGVIDQDGSDPWEVDTGDLLGSTF